MSNSSIDISAEEIPCHLSLEDLLEYSEPFTGNKHLLLLKKMPSHPYENDSFAINFMTWKGLMESRYCIDESLTIACLTTDSVVFQYEKLGEYVMDHLKQLDEVPEEDLKKAVSTFLRDFPSKDDAYYYITRNISLYCIPLYVSQFK